MTRARLFVYLSVACLLLAARGQAATVEVQALLGNMAVLSIDGQRQSLRVGQSHGEVTLIATTADSAVVEIAGHRQTLGLSQRVSTSYQPVKEKVVTIPRDRRNQYTTTALINGRSAQVMIDTGANVVAMSLTQARALGIDASKGEPSRVQTASGIAEAHAIKLDSVSVGGIHINRVDATVIAGDYPETILLGMSYLRHVRMQEDSGIMSLSRLE